MIARSYLYVPADNATMLEKAHTRGSDALIIDLEDSVPGADKADARRCLAEWLPNAATEQQIWVRINADSIDNDLLVADHEKVTGIVVPKATVENLTSVSVKVKKVRQLSALIETAQSVLNAVAIAKVQKVNFLQVGQLDLRAELGLPMNGQSRTLDHVLNHLVLASAAAGINQPIAPMYREFNDVDGLRKSCQAMKADGFFGRSCVHPKQVAVINEEFSTSPEEIAQAQAIIDALQVNPGVGVDAGGSMVDEASVKIALRIIKRANQ